MKCVEKLTIVVPHHKIMCQLTSKGCLFDITLSFLRLYQKKQITTNNNYCTLSITITTPFILG